MIQIHVDVDNIWMYEQEFNISVHKKKDDIYTQSLPLFLELLKQKKSKATFMIIGKDLQLKAARDFCKKAAGLGHEIANHSFSHPITFGTLSLEKKKQEIIKADSEITKVCGEKPIGFRGPGYYVDESIIRILKDLGYKYDASILPGFAKLFMESYALLQNKENKHKTFGKNTDIFFKNSPKVLKTKNKLFELPISVFPFFRLPIHTTFAYYFGSTYQDLIIKHLARQKQYSLYLFHAIDFLDVPKQKNHPVITFRYSFSKRMEFAEKIIDSLVLANGTGLTTTKDQIKTIHRSH